VKEPTWLNREDCLAIHEIPQRDLAQPRFLLDRNFASRFPADVQQ
jgi:hypothetical protein